MQFMCMRLKPAHRGVVGMGGGISHDIRGGNLRRLLQLDLQLELADLADDDLGGERIKISVSLPVWQPIAVHTRDRPSRQTLASAFSLAWLKLKALGEGVGRGNGRTDLDAGDAAVHLGVNICRGQTSRPAISGQFRISMKKFSRWGPAPGA